MKNLSHKLLILLILTGSPAGISVKATLINEQDKTKQAKEKSLKIFTRAIQTEHYPLAG
jgi:hypothetical protein